MDVKSFLSGRLCGVNKLAVLGVGSVLRGDDIAGVEIARRLSEKFPQNQYPDLLFCEGETAPENFSGKIQKFAPSHLLVIDAADVGKEPGSIVDIDPMDVGGPAFLSHMLPIKIMVDYLVGETGMAVTLLGIQYQSLAFDAPMTAVMEEAVDEVYRVLEELIEDLML